MERNHLININSKEFDSINQTPKLPNIQDIEYGEIAINYLSDNEKISLKNSNDKIITISSDKQNEYKFLTKEQFLTLGNAINDRINVIDEVVSKTFDSMNKSCGFNEDVAYTPQNELIKDCVSLSEAMEIVAEKANSPQIDTSSFATKEELTTKVDTSIYIEDKATFALKSELEGKVDNTEIADMLTKTEASSVYQPKGDYLTEIPEEYVTETELNGKEYATKSWVNEQGYLTAHQDISQLATKKEVELKADKARVDEIDEVVSKAFDSMNKSCGFSEEVAYTPQNELIKDCASLSEAMEIVAEKANSSQIDTSSFATKEELTDKTSIKYAEGVSDSDGYISTNIIPQNENIIVISMVFLHPTLNLWCPCISYQTITNNRDVIVTGGLRGSAVVVGGSVQAQTFPQCKYRIFYYNI